MRRILAVICLLAATSALYAEWSLRLNPGFQPYGMTYSSERDLSSNGKDQTSAGFSVDGDLLYHLTEWVHLGLGAGAYFSRNRVGEEGSFQNYPFFGTIRVLFPTEGFQSWAEVKTGYTMWTGDDLFTAGGALTGGLYFEAGGGVAYPVLYTNSGALYISLGAAYQLTTGALETGGVTENLRYTALHTFIGLELTF